MAEPLKLVVPEERRVAGMIEALEKLLAKARSGELLGGVIAVETKDSYDFCKLGCTYEHALGLNARLAYWLNRMWDDV